MGVFRTINNVLHIILLSIPYVSVDSKLLNNAKTISV